MSGFGEALAEKNLEKGLEIGLEIGADQINRLNARLLRENRIEDLQKATIDPTYQKELLNELFPESLLAKN